MISNKVTGLTSQDARTHAHTPELCGCYIELSLSGLDTNLTFIMYLFVGICPIEGRIQQKRANVRVTNCEMTTHLHMITNLSQDGKRLHSCLAQFVGKMSSETRLNVICSN